MIESSRLKTAAAILVLLGIAMASPASGGEGFMPPLPRRERPKPRFKKFEEVQEDIVQLPAQLVNCPVCRHPIKMVLLTRPGPDGKGRVPASDWTLTSDDYDADLCPHPVGRIRFNADIPFCPRCGFAAFQSDFIEWLKPGRPFPPEAAVWIRETLEPVVRTVEFALVGRNTTESGEAPEQLVERLMTVFVEQEVAPDELRCESARSVYERLGAPAWLRAKIAWFAAWSHRRALVNTPDVPYILKNVQRVQRELGVTRTEGFALTRIDMEPEKQIEKLLAFLQPPQADPQSGDSRQPDPKSRGAEGDRVYARLLLAGLYNRLGYQDWANHVFQAIEADLRLEYPDAMADPLWHDSNPEESDQNRRRETQVRRTAMLDFTLRSRQHLAREAELLREAGILIRQGLDDGTYAELPGRQIASHMYLSGEFARRTGEYARAWVWLRASAELYDPANPEPGLEALAAAQLDGLNDYLAASGLPSPPDYARDVPLDEIRLADRLIKEEKAWRAAQ